MFLRDLEKFRKAGLVIHRKVGQHLAVERKTLFLEPADQTAVGQPFGSRSRVDARDPQCAEIALTAAPVAERINERMQQRLVGSPVRAATRGSL